MKTMLLVLSLMLAGCSGSAPDSAVATAAPAAAPESPAAPASPAAPETPAPAEPAAAPASTAAAALPAPDAARRPPEDLLTQDGVYYGCKTDADCQVKDVGNCCGYYPACVNKDSPTFPEQVKAKCAAEGISSICGFPEISGCSCVEGRCAALSGAGGAVQ